MISRTVQEQSRDNQTCGGIEEVLRQQTDIGTTMENKCEDTINKVTSNMNM